MNTTTEREITEAVARSISHNEIVTLEWTEERETELMTAAADDGGDSVDAGEVFEAWGGPGQGWRVHLRRPSAD